MSDVSLIRLDRVSKLYEVGEHGIKALDDISLTIEHGEMVAIMGASGSGKSTLMNMLGCLDRPTSGHYWLADEDVSKLTDNELARIRNRRIGFVFQSFNLLARTSAIENVELPMIYSGIKNRRQKAIDALNRVKLGARMSSKPSQLSGGEQQRVAIARAIVTDPDIIMADEPTGNLDSKVSIEIISIFWEFNQAGKTVILVTHEEDIASFAGRVLRMVDGKIVSDIQQVPRLARESGVQVPQVAGAEMRVK
jgi:putative ABC transport system ATP-binding protein